MPIEVIVTKQFDHRDARAYLLNLIPSSISFTERESDNLAVLYQFQADEKIGINVTRVHYPQIDENIVFGTIEEPENLKTHDVIIDTYKDFSVAILNTPEAE